MLVDLAAAAYGVKGLGFTWFRFISTHLSLDAGRWVAFTLGDLEGLSWDHHIRHTGGTAPSLAVLAVTEGLQRDISYMNISWMTNVLSLVVRTGVFIADLAAKAASLGSSHSD